MLIPFDREIESKVLELYQEMVRHFSKEFTTTIEEDQELEENQNIKYEERVAFMMRI